MTAQRGLARHRGRYVVAVLTVLAGLAAFVGSASANPAYVQPPAPPLEAQGNVAAAAGWARLEGYRSYQMGLPDVVAHSVATGVLGSPVSVGELLADTRTYLTPVRTGGALRWKSECGTADDVLKPLDRAKRVGGWCWQGADQTSSTWIPQGIASTAEASDTGAVDGQRAVAAAWYKRDLTSGSALATRVSFFRVPAGGSPLHYNHVALVRPGSTEAGDLTFIPVHLHASALAWVGPYLFVSQADYGIRVYDTRLIFRVARNARVGAATPGGTLSAGGARFAMLEIGRFSGSPQTCRRKPLAPFCIGTLSVDRSTTPPSLVVSEYLTRTDMHTRLRRGATVGIWPATPDAWLSPYGKGVVATGLMSSFTHHAQGMVMNQATRDTYLSASTASDGWFYYDKDGDGRVPRKTSEWPAGAEDLSYWYSTGRLWSLTEVARQRMVFWVYACEMRGGSASCR